MPRVISCEGCQQSHLIRDGLVGRRILCDCGRTHTVPPSAPSAPAPTGLLDTALVRMGSVGLLLVSMLVLGGVIAWVAGFDFGLPSSTPIAALPPTTKKQKPPTAAKKKKAPEQKDPKLVELLEQLKAPDLETKREAIKGMAELDDAIARQAIPALIAAAQQHDNEDFRQLIAQELKGRGAPLATDYDCLKVALRIPHPAFPRYVLSALKDLGEKARAALGVLVGAMKHRDLEVRSEAIALLKPLGPTAAPPALRLLLNPSGDEDEEASLAVLKLLLGESKSLTAEETDALIETLHDGKRRPRMRCFAVENLGKSEQAARAVPALLDVLQEKSDGKLLSLSIKALSRIGGKRKEVVTALLTLSRSAEEEGIRLESLQALEQLDPSALSAAQILERWTAETSSGVKQELDKMLRSRLALLKRDRMEELRPLLRHKDRDIVLVGLNAVQVHKEEAAAVVLEVANLLDHDADTVREAVLNALEALGPAVETALPTLPRLLLNRWTRESAPAVQKTLLRLLQSRLAALKPEQMKNLLPLLRHKDNEIVLVGLKIVQAHKAKAADVAADVGDLLKHEDAKVRQAALIALQALGGAAGKAMPHLTQMLLDRWLVEKETTVREAVADLLRSHLALLKRDQMQELLPLLRHKNKELILIGLKAVQVHKEEAADMAAAVAELLNDKTPRVREAVLVALKALGSASHKALPQLFEQLKERTQYRRTALTLTIAGMIDLSNTESVDRLVPFLLEGLHPKAIQEQDKAAEAAIIRVLVKIGQPAVEGCFTILDAGLKLEVAGADNINHRRKLYEALAKLGPTCKLKAHYERLLRLRKKEAAKNKFNKDVIAAAGIALAAMDPDD